MQSICYAYNPYSTNSGFYADVNNNDGTFWNWDFASCTTSNVCCCACDRRGQALQDYSYTAATGYNYFRCCSLRALCRAPSLTPRRVSPGTPAQAVLAWAVVHRRRCDCVHDAAPRPGYARPPKHFPRAMLLALALCLHAAAAAAGVSCGKLTLAVRLMRVGPPRTAPARPPHSIPIQQQQPTLLGAARRARKLKEIIFA